MRQRRAVLILSFSGAGRACCPGAGACALWGLRGDPESELVSLSGLGEYVAIGDDGEAPLRSGVRSDVPAFIVFFDRCVRELLRFEFPRFQSVCVDDRSNDASRSVWSDLTRLDRVSDDLSIWDDLVDCCFCCVWSFCRFAVVIRSRSPLANNQTERSVYSQHRTDNPHFLILAHCFHLTSA